MFQSRISLILTREIEIELSGGRERAAADYREEGKVNRQREAFTEQKSRNQHAESRFAALYNVSEWNRYFRHANRRGHVAYRVRDSNLQPPPDI